MLMLSHAHEVPRAALRGIPTPDPTDTWRPVPHADVVDVLTERAGARGLRITSERFAVLPGYLYPTPGTTVELPGARLFGSMDFAPVPDMPFPPGCTPSAGIRNSHDKSFALSILSGARVLVCANGVLSAEFVVNRKHTSRIDLVESVDNALDAFMESVRGFQALHDRLTNCRLTRMRVHSMVVEMARAGAFASSDILPVLDEYEHPSHEEFAERNAWSLYNAATARMKSQSPARQVDGFRALNTVLMPLAN
ncbi:MAG: DUF932 domain-containing protein [Planctomycetota bacterium]|nr:DUF932 domain-containing protein [Planctomycetota bacterium]